MPRRRNSAKRFCLVRHCRQKYKRNLRRIHASRFDQFGQDRKLFHDQFTSKDPWPIPSEAEYNSFIDACPKSEAPILKPDFGPVEKPPLQDAPGPTLPPGQAYV
jgi:hypothetical protein